MDVQSHWDQVYAQRDPTEVSWYQDVPRLSLEWITEVLPPHRDPRILDVGAGASTLVDHLLESGYRCVLVLDVAPNALEQARQRIGSQAADVTWITADLLTFEPPDPSDLWHDRAVLHFLRDSEQQRGYAEVLRKSLKPGGYAIIATFAVGGPTRCSGLETEQYDSTRLLELVGPGFTLLRERQELHHTPVGAEQLFTYFLLHRTDHA